MNFIIYDLEATCWQGIERPDDQEIIEIGAILINAYGEVLSDFDRFVRPVIHPQLSAFCTELTSITQNQVNMANRFQDVVEDFQDWAKVFDEDYLLCSWSGFDKHVLANNCKMHDMDHEWVYQHIDLKKQYQKIKKRKNPIGLKNAVQKEGFEFTGIQHRAIADAENLAKIFLRYIDEWVY